MSGYFSPGDRISNQLLSERGSATRMLLLMLLLLVAAVGYLYYFTDYLRPRQEAAKPPVAQTVQVKQPIPPRPAQPGDQAAVPTKPAAAKPPQEAPAASVVPVPAPASTKVQPAQKPALPPVKPEPVKTAKVEAPAQSAPPAATAPKPVTAAAAPTPAAKKVPPPATLGQSSQKAAGNKMGGPYRLLIEDFVPDKKFAAVRAKLKKSGIAPVRMSTLQAPASMNRLYVAEFAEHDKAEDGLQKLRKLTADAFLISENGKYLLYAGSYYYASRAAAELKKLSAKGVKPVIRKAQVTIKVTRVTAGSYASSEEARNDARRLKKQGLAAKVIRAEEKR